MKQYRDTKNKIDTTRAGGRPRKAKYDQRHNHHKVSYNDEEEAIIQMKAAEYSGNDASYLHDIGLTGEVYARFSDEDREQLRVICGIANNTNQIAHSANAAGLYQVKTKAENLLDLLYELIQRILRGGNLSKPIPHNKSD